MRPMRIGFFMNGSGIGLNSVEESPRDGQSTIFLSARGQGEAEPPLPILFSTACLRPGPGQGNPRCRQLEIKSRHVEDRLRHPRNNCRQPLPTRCQEISSRCQPLVRRCSFTPKPCPEVSSRCPPPACRCQVISRHGASIPNFCQPTLFPLLAQFHPLTTYLRKCDVLGTEFHLATQGQSG